MVEDNKIPMKFDTKWIPYIIIGILAIILYFVWTSESVEPEENQKIIAAEARIDSLEELIDVNDSLIEVYKFQADSIETATESKIDNDKADIETKYVEVKADILKLSDNDKVLLLRRNLGVE